MQGQVPDKTVSDAHEAVIHDTWYRRPKLLFIKHQTLLFVLTLTRLPSDECVTKSSGTNSFFPRYSQISFFKTIPALVLTF